MTQKKFKFHIRKKGCTIIAWCQAQQVRDAIHDLLMKLFEEYVRDGHIYQKEITLSIPTPQGKETLPDSAKSEIDFAEYDGFYSDFGL